MNVTLIGKTDTGILNYTEFLAAIARRCYSIKPFSHIKDTVMPNSAEPKSKQVDAKKLIKKIIESGHHCYDENTEVLTKEGFKFWKDITTKDLLAVFDPNTRKLLRYEIPKELICNDYDGDMFLYNSNKCSLMVTPHHRLFCSLSKSVKHRLNPTYEFHYADETLNTKRVKNKLVAESPMRFTSSLGTQMKKNYNPLNLPLNKLEAFSKLIGFFIGDGYSSGGNILQFHLKKERKILYLKQLCATLGFNLEIKLRNKYIVKYNNIGVWADNNLYKKIDGKRTKIIPNEYLSSNEKIIRSIVDGLLNSDGSINKTCIVFDTTSMDVAYKMHALLCLIGERWSLKRKKLDKGFIYRLTSANRHLEPHINDSRDKKSYVKKVHYKGKVYCARVSTGLLLVRRGSDIKYPILSGNSILEHISLTFSIEDVPVYLVSQLTRHRMASFAVTSFRYNNLTKKGMDDTTYIPKELTNKQKEIFGEAILSSFSKYSKLIEDGVKPEVARGVLPQGAFTNLIMTMNVRELFHFLDLRNCLRADKPIRELAQEILKICETLDSYLFSFAKHSCKDCSKFATCDVVRTTPICKYNIAEEKK